MRPHRKYIAGVLAAFAFIIVFTQTTHAAAADGQQLNVPQGSNASLNWSGYVAGGNGSQDNYTSVTGSWVVPNVPASSANSADATWVGIGGVQSRDLVQAGTQALVQDGVVTYSAWIETLPGFSKTVPLAVQSGDSVTASVTQEAPGSWLVTINDNTRGTSYSKTVAYNSSRSSAEWVEEMVSNGNGTFRPLDSFGSIAFTNAEATVNGASENLTQLGAQPLQMVNGLHDSLASVSTIGADNTSFTVARSTALATVAPVTVIVRHRRHAYISTSGGTYRIVGLPSSFSIERF